MSPDPTFRRLQVADLDPLPVTCRETIPESYLDLMQHMNVMWYTHLFSRATLEFFDMFGMHLDYWKTSHTGTFALEAHIRYLTELRVGDRVLARTRAVGHSVQRIHFMHFLVQEDAQVVATIGEFISAHIDMNTRRMAPMPEEMLVRLDKLCTSHARLDWPAPLCGVMHPARRPAPPGSP